jgi:hypothetical protein
MSPSLALAYFLWTRHRLFLSLFAVYWLALIVLGQILPVESETAVKVVLVFSSPVVTMLLVLLVIFSFSRDARLEARESGFPSRLWHLPLPTYALVGWPMLWGSGLLALAWLTLVWGALGPALRPQGIELPLVWPALMLAVVLAWLQAISWTPFPLPWLRAVVLIPLISPLIAFVPLAETFDLSAAIRDGLLVALLLAAYGVAVVGVARARRGDGPYWTWPGWSARLRWTSRARVRPAFGSDLRAQVWFEWRRVGLGFPVMIFACSLLWIPLIPTTAGFIDKAHAAGLTMRPPFLLRELGSLWLVISDVLVFAPFLASVCSLEMGRLPGRERNLALSSFLATRPVSAWTFVRAKFEAAALSTLAGWGVATAGILLWIALGGHAAEMAESFAALRQRHPGNAFWIGLVLLVGGSVVLTWLQMVQGLWIGLIGRSWRTTITTIMIAVILGLLCLISWLVNSPQHWQRFFDLLPWLGGALLALKFFLVFRISRILVRGGVVAANIVHGALAVWGLCAAGLIGLLYWLLPSERVSVFELVLGIGLALPLTRLLLAPLALAWNRHR